MDGHVASNFAVRKSGTIYAVVPYITRLPLKTTSVPFHAHRLRPFVGQLHANGIAEARFSASIAGSMTALPPFVARGSRGEATTTFWSGFTIVRSWAYVCP